MTARILRLALAVELLFYAFVAGYVGRELGWSEAQSAGAMLLVMLGTRAGVIAVTFAYGWTYRSPRPTGLQIGVPAALRMILAEYAAFLALFVLIQPFERWFMGAERVRRAAKGEMPVLLVHGYCCNRGVWWRLRRRVEQAGFCVATVNLEPMYGSIDDYVEPLHRRIEALCAETGAQRVALVAHSMGGMACRAYLARHGAARAAKLVTLGSPHHGSEIARIGLGRNARQVEPGSAWLRALEQKGFPAGLPLACLYSAHDNFVMPQDSNRLEGADNRPFAGVGHLEMMFSRPIGAALVAALKD